MTTTTAAFDCQSKPNHMTMIGAMPTIGSADDEVAERQQAALQERQAVDQRRATRKPGAAADRSRGSPPCRKVCTKSAAERRQRGRERCGQIAHGAGSSTRGTAKPTHDDLPAANSSVSAEQQRRPASRRRAAASAGAQTGERLQISSASSHAASPGGRAPSADHDRTRIASACAQHQREACRAAAGTPATRPATSAGCDRQRSPRRSWPRAHARRASAARRAPTSADEAAQRQRRHDQRRPDLHGLAVVGAGEQPRAEAGLRAGRQFADDGADQAERRSRPSGWRTGTAATAGQRSLPEGLRPVAL